jgi:type 1 fimbria pilin
MNKTLHYRKIALAASALLAMGSVHLSAVSADAVIQMQGEVTAPSCLLMGQTNGAGSTQSASSLTMTLGTGKVSEAATSSAIGSALGSKWSQQTISFSLSSDGEAGSGGNCSFGTDVSGWDILVNPDTSDSILTDNGATYLKNNLAATANGTDAVVVIKGGIDKTVTDAFLPLTVGGTTLSSTSGNPFRALSTSSITMAAQMVAGTINAKPTAGKYQSSINLLVKYN